MLAVLDPAVFYDSFVHNRIDEYTSFVLEEVCKEFLVRKNLMQAEGVFCEIGRYWWNDKALKKEVADLQNRSGSLEPYRFGGFSRSGFSDEAETMLDRAYEVGDLFL